MIAWRSTKSSFGARPTWSSFFQYFLNQHFNVSKNYEKNLDVKIYVLYNLANFQSEIVCTLTYTKMTKSVRSENFKSDTVHRLRSRNYHFYTAQNTKYFVLVFCTLVELIIFYNYIFLQKNSKHKNINFAFFKKRVPWSLSSKTLHSPAVDFLDKDTVVLNGLCYLS